MRRYHKANSLEPVDTYYFANNNACHFAFNADERFLPIYQFADEAIAAYINTLKAGEGLSETAIREGYSWFKKEKDSTELAAIAAQHKLAPATLQTFVDGILQRMIFDGEVLSDLMAPLDLGWKARAQAELALMADLHPLLTKRAHAISEFEKYRIVQDCLYVSDFDAVVQKLNSDATRRDLAQMRNKTKIAGRNEDGHPALVPKLRFPEFLGAGGGC